MLYEMLEEQELFTVFIAPGDSISSAVLADQDACSYSMHLVISCKWHAASDRTKHKICYQQAVSLTAPRVTNNVSHVGDSALLQQILHPWVGLGNLLCQQAVIR